MLESVGALVVAMAHLIQQSVVFLKHLAAQVAVGNLHFRISAILVLTANFEQHTAVLALPVMIQMCPEALVELALLKQPVTTPAIIQTCLEALVEVAPLEPLATTPAPLVALVGAAQLERESRAPDWAWPHFVCLVTLVSVQCAFLTAETVATPTPLAFLVGALHLEQQRFAHDQHVPTPRHLAALAESGHVPTHWSLADLGHLRSHEAVARTVAALATMMWKVTSLMSAPLLPPVS